MEIGGSVTSGVRNTLFGGVNLRENHRNAFGNRWIANFGGWEYGIWRGEFEGKS